MPEGQGFAVLCDSKGRILETRRDDLGLNIHGHDDLVAIVDKGDRGKLARFLIGAAAGEFTFDWPINAMVGGELSTLCFGAVGDEHRLVVMAARTRSDLARLGSVVGDKLPSTMEMWNAQAVRGDGQDARVFDEMTRLNNELVTTQRRLMRSNRDLRRANEELNAFYQALPVGAFRARLDGRIAQANARFHLLTGSEEGGDWLRGIHPDDAERVRARWQDCLEGTLSFESVHRQFAGGEVPRHLDMRMVPVFDENGEPTGFVGVVEDVSHRLRAEAQARELERQNAVQSLTGGLAHNLNNIVAAIMMSAEQLHDGIPDDAPAREDLRRIVIASERAAVLTRRLMVYAGQSYVALDDVKLDDVVAEVGGAFAQGLPAPLTFTLELSAPDATVGIDSELLAETIRELLANAGAALGENGRIVLSTRLVEADSQDPAPRPMAAVVVRDDGAGMDAETLARAKEPFFTTRDVGGGFGLGLSFADGVARAAGGALRLFSGAGEGTVAEMLLPLSRPLNRQFDDRPPEF